MPNLPGACPFCDGAIVVTAFACERCEAEVKGQFKPNPLAALDAVQAEFALSFHPQPREH